jgi:hypothetical protein
MTDYDRRIRRATTATSRATSTAMATTEKGVHGSATRIDIKSNIRGTILPRHTKLMARSRMETRTRYAG